MKIFLLIIVLNFSQLVVAKSLLRNGDYKVVGRINCQSNGRECIISVAENSLSEQKILVPFSHTLKNMNGYFGELTLRISSTTSEIAKATLTGVPRRVLASQNGKIQILR